MCSPAAPIQSRYVTARFPPRFLDDAVEQAFRKHVPSTVRGLITGGIITAAGAWLLLFFILGVYADHLETGRAQAAPALVTMAVVTAVTSIIVTRQKRGLLATAALLNCGTGIATLYLGLFVLEQPVLALGGVLAVIMYSAAFFRLPLQLAALATLPYVLAFQFVISMPELTHLSESDAFIFSVLLWVFEAFAIAAAFVNEVSARTQFAQGQIIEAQQRELESERDKTERLLRNVLPEVIAKRLREGEDTIAEVLPDVTVMFSDVVGFTTMSEKLPAAELVRILNRIFSAFDELADRHQLEKIKTIGDAYMAAAGSPVPNPAHARAAAEMALGMLEVVQRLNSELGTSLQIRIGLNSGSVVAGVIGRKKFTYDLWGDAVNTAARMESHGVAGAIQVTEETYALLESDFVFEPRGFVDVKGKGQMRTFLLLARRQETLARSG